MSYSVFFFFNATATTANYTYCHTLSLHDALPICLGGEAPAALHRLRHRLELVHLDLGQLEQCVGRASDVLELVREVHARDLARAFATRGPIGQIGRAHV